MAKTVKPQPQVQPQEEAVVTTQESTPIENTQEQPKEENVETPVAEATITTDTNVEEIILDELPTVAPSSTPYYDELKSNKFKLVGGQYIPNY